MIIFLKNSAFYFGMIKYKDIIQMILNKQFTDRGATGIHMNTKSLHFDKTINKWDEALPLGNGDIGCLIWNSSNKLRFSLDKGGIWDCSNPPENQKDFTYENIKYLVAHKKQKQLKRKYDDCYGNPTPTKLPAGKIILNLGAKENLISDLDFQTAQARLTIGNISVKSFVHASDNYGLIEINKTDVNLTVDNPKFGKSRKPLFKFISTGNVQSLKSLHYPNAQFCNTTENNIDYQYFIQPTNNCYYGIITAKREYGGKTLIAYSIGAGKDKTFMDTCKRIVAAAIKTGYDTAFESHKKWWERYWKQSSIALPDKLLEKQWYLNNYLLASCSRKNKFPMPLQGVWTADNGSLPPWKGDYHHDLNTQMSYTSYLKANHLEQGECFIDYLLDMADAGRRFAKSFYHADGLCMPSVMDIEGHALGGWCQYALSPVNQLWLCQIMARYYYYTKDKDYLEKIYPYMQEVGKFLLSILEDKNGVYKLPLSTSPEIHDNSLKAWLTPNSNYDLALMRCFAENMIKLSNETGNTNAALEWQKHLKKFEPLAVNENNILMLSPDESPSGSHRHHSHCMSIYPLRTLEYTAPENRNIIDSTVRDLERHGISEWVGYSVGWIAQFYIIQGNGEKAVNMLRDFFNYNCTDNGFHVNGDFKFKTKFKMKYRLFTLEGNFIAADAIQELLLYSEWGRIKLFPAISGDWKNAEFENFRAFGGLLVSCKLTGGKISYLKIAATADCSFEIENDLSHLTPNVQINNLKNIFLKKDDILKFE